MHFEFLLLFHSYAILEYLEYTPHVLHAYGVLRASTNMYIFILRFIKIERRFIQMGVLE